MDIEKNIKLHNKIAKKYEATHTEIYMILNKQG